MGNTQPTFISCHVTPRLPIVPPFRFTPLARISFCGYPNSAALHDTAPMVDNGEFLHSPSLDDNTRMATHYRPPVAQNNKFISYFSLRATVPLGHELQVRQHVHSLEPWRSRRFGNQFAKSYIRPLNCVEGFRESVQLTRFRPIALVVADGELSVISK
jgi:hypothetical protein